MTQYEQNTLAADSLIRKAMQESDLRKAHMLIDAAHRLDNTVSVNCYKESITNQWLIRQANRCPDERQQVGFILE